MGRALKKFEPSSKPLISRKDYKRFSKIDGSHPFQEKVPFGYITYKVRYRENGRVRYFNYELAKEMGLIPSSHEARMNEKLEKEILETFALMIINEYDVQKNIDTSKFKIKDKPYMATRYLQLQHPGKTGLTSGDGRSIWNGMIEHKGVCWDISSCGTGATALSPATAISKTFFRTGDPNVSYGCGYSTLQEGLIDTIYTESFYQNHIETERILCVIEFEKGFGITVRAGKNLMRPSHFFNHLKQSNWERCKSVTDYHIDREVSNGDWKMSKDYKSKYDMFLANITKTFARISALFESEYIFCWLDWDGDNILANGGIIDYGSVRQFGAYHHEYKFDDDDRWSTNIKQQKQKAKYTVQTFAQLVDFIKTGTKKPIKKFSNSKALRDFEKIYNFYKKEFLLEKLGFNRDERHMLIKKNRRLINDFEKHFSYFEHLKTSAGPCEVPDGINWHPVMNMRYFLHALEYEKDMHKEKSTVEFFIKASFSVYANEKDMKLDHKKVKHMTRLLLAFEKLTLIASKATGRKTDNLSDQLQKRRQIINHPDRMTGDAACIVVDKLLRQKQKLTTSQLHKVIHDFIDTQNFRPDSKVNAGEQGNKKTKPALNTLLKVVQQYREGI